MDGFRCSAAILAAWQAGRPQSRDRKPASNRLNVGNTVIFQREGSKVLTHNYFIEEYL